MNAIHISRTSLFCRFLSTNWLTRDWSPPSNLCPFMRQIFVGIVLNTLVFGTFAFLGSSMIWAIVVVFGNWIFLSSAQLALAVVGGALWASLTLVSLGFLYHHTIGQLKITRKAAAKLGQTSSYQITAAWVRSAHEKICPSVTFVNAEDDHEYEEL